MRLIRSTWIEEEAEGPKGKVRGRRSVVRTQFKGKAPRRQRLCSSPAPSGGGGRVFEAGGGPEPQSHCPAFAENDIG